MQYIDGLKKLQTSGTDRPEYRQNNPLRNNRIDEKSAINRAEKLLNVCYGGATDNRDDSIDDDNDEVDEDGESDDDDDDDLTVNDDDDARDTDDTQADERNEAEDDEAEEDDEADYNDEDSDDEDDPKPRKQGNKKSRNPSMLETGANSLTTAASAAFKLTKGGVKLAVDLVSAKHVTVGQIVGKWRMDQEVQISKEASVTCPATLEFTEDGKVITTFEGKIFSSEFKFTERPWPRKCTIQFEATAYQGPRDKEPISMFYKGYFKKSIMNPNVVLIRGKVYKLLGKLFWKQQKKCGTFRATQKRYR